MVAAACLLLFLATVQAQGRLGLPQLEPNPVSARVSTEWGCAVSPYEALPFSP